jgi:predicted dehydrogenase
MAETVGFGIQGLGLIAPFHAKALRDVAGGELVAVCDLDKERADGFAGEYGAKACYSLDEMLQVDGLDVVNVCTPSQLHYQDVMKAIRAGKHVLVEKPPALSLAEIDEMVAVAAEGGLKLGCVVQCRVRGCVRAVKEAVEEGRFGEVRWVSGYMKWFRPTEYYHTDPWRSVKKFGSGVTIHHAIHYIDLLQFLGGKVKRVDARMMNVGHPAVELEDSLIARLEYENGARGGFEASTSLWPGLEPRIEVLGRDGTAVIVGEAMETWRFRDERPGDAEACRIGDSAQAAGATGAADFGHHDHTVILRDMIDAIREERDVAVPVASVRHTMEIVLGMYQSARGNAPVEFPVRDDPSIWE